MRAEALDGETLRSAAVTASSDARLRSMLEASEVTAVAAGDAWEASHGAVQGYALTVGLCAEHLAALDASPATRDMLERGFAVAVAGSPGCAMTGLTTHWNRRGVVRLGTYREIAQASVEVTLDEGLRRYLSSRPDEHGGATNLRVEEAEHHVEVGARSSVDRRSRESIEGALRSMLGKALDVRWQSR